MTVLIHAGRVQLRLLPLNVRFGRIGAVPVVNFSSNKRQDKRTDNAHFVQNNSVH